MNQAEQNSELFPQVRQRVKNILTRSQAFRQLPPDRQRELAHDMVKVASYIVGGENGNNTPTAAALAPTGTAVPIGQLRPLKPIDPAGDTAGQRFQQAGAVAAQQGVAAYTDLIQKVDFPKFVGGLIDGVFNAIVDASIKQMEAYAELVKNVAKSVDQYMKDNVSENQARDFLAEKYPDHLEVDIAGEKPKLKPREGADENNLPDFFSDLGLKVPVDSLDEDTVEETLVPAARKRIAMDRQQLLATMVLMGINRLVVTDGHLEASVLFELDTTDEVKRKFGSTAEYERARASGYEYGHEGGRTFEASGDAYKYKSNRSWYGKGTGSDTAHFKVSTTRSEDSTAKVDLHAKLGGKVKINFKSETFPLEKMADVLAVNQIREKAPGVAAAPPAQPAPVAEKK